MSFIASSSRETKNFNKILKKIKVLLPTLVENSVQPLIKQKIEEQLKVMLKPTIKEMIDVIHTDITEAEKRIKAIENQINNIHQYHMKKYESLSTQVLRFDAKVKQACKKKSAVSGSISSLQQQITKLKTELKTEAEKKLPTSRLESIEKDINHLRSKIIKIEDIEDFQDFVSRQHDSLERTVLEHTKLVTDVEKNMRDELQNGLAYFEKEFFAENGKLSKIRQNFANDVSKNNKIINELKENFEKSDRRKNLESEPNGDKIVKSEQLKKYDHKIDEVKKTLEAYEQYLRRNCLKIDGIPQTKGENTNEIAVDIFRDMGFNVNPSHFDRSHRLKRSLFHRNNGRNLPSPIIVKFVNHDLKEAIFEERDMLRQDPKFKNIYLNESLTAFRNKLYKEVRSLHNIGWYTWTRDGVIFASHCPRNSGAKQHRITCYKDYYRIIEEIGASHSKNTCSAR